MPLGNAFPLELVHASIKRQLKPGTIVKFKAVMDDGKVHEKRFLLLSVDDSALTCVINSDVPKLVRGNPAVMKCQVAILQSDHDFMARDSHIDCSRIRRYLTSEVCEQLIDKPNWVLGKISLSLRDEVCSALKASPLEIPMVVASCCSALDGAELA